jgi:hypothetical protein
MDLDPNALMMSNNLILNDIKSGDANKIILALNLVNQCADEQMVQTCLPLITPFILSIPKDFKVCF